jgi:hypothetical protein
VRFAAVGNAMLDDDAGAAEALAAHQIQTDDGDPSHSVAARR